jgi:hypothetical protein
VLGCTVTRHLRCESTGRRHCEQAQPGRLAMGVVVFVFVGFIFGLIPSGALVGREVWGLGADGEDSEVRSRCKWRAHASK